MCSRRRVSVGDMRYELRSAVRSNKMRAQRFFILSPNEVFKGVLDALRSW